MYGVVEGLMRCQEGRVEDLNKRIASRNQPGGYLQSTFSPRPVPTRYVKMPAIDCKKPANVFIKNRGTYTPYKTFNPGTAQAPWSGFAEAVDQDSRLKNIFFPLQKCPQSQYIPGSESQLYKYEMMVQPVEMSHGLLFNSENFDNKNPNKCDLSKKLFNNFTRHDVKSLSL